MKRHLDSWFPEELGEALDKNENRTIAVISVGVVCVFAALYLLYLV